jgi:hypothetical protein
LLFTTSKGGLINPSNLRQRSFARLLKEARLPHIRFHEPEAHLRDAAVDSGNAPQVRPGSTGTRHHSDNPGHLLPRHARHGRSDRARYAGRALLKAAALVSERTRRTPCLIFTSAFYLQSEDFLKWACLDSNQGPLPYQSGGPSFAASVYSVKVSYVHHLDTECRSAEYRHVPSWLVSEPSA